MPGLSNHSMLIHALFLLSVKLSKCVNDSCDNTSVNPGFSAEYE